MSRSTITELSIAALLVASITVGAVACSDDDPPGSSAATDSASTTGAPATAVDTPPVASNLLEPVGAGVDVDLGDGVTVRLISSDEIDAEPGGPGETAGPGVSVTLEVHNGSDDPVNLSQIAASGTYDESTPAEETTGPPADPFVDTIESGESGRGVYVFRVPRDQSDSLVVSLAAGFSPDVAQFEV